MSQQHKGLPVLGYLPQSDEKVALANTNKELEERCLRRIEWFEKENAKFYNAYMEKHRNDAFLSFPAQSTKPVFKYPYDFEMLRDAKKQIVAAFMLFNRAIFQPARAPLPEDEHEQG